MSFNAYLTLKGLVQRDILGSCDEAGREGSIVVIGVSHEVTSPIDATTGHASGARQHNPFVITKEVDRSSPRLYSALATNELLTKWDLRYWEQSASGQSVQYYLVQLHGAHIVSIRHEMLNNKYPENMQLKERELIAFCYKKITWTYADGGVSAADEWANSGV